MADEQKSLDDVLSEVVNRRTGPVLASVAVAQDFLRKLGDEVMRGAIDGARSAMLSSVGVPNRGSSDIPGAVNGLRKAIDALFSHFEPELESKDVPEAKTKETPSEAIDAPIQEITIEEEEPEAAARRAERHRELPEELMERVRDAMDVAYAVVADAETEGKFRMLLRLRLSAAEIRLVIKEVPDGHEVNKQLVECIGAMGRAKSISGITEFVKGLGRNQNGNWQTVIDQARKELARFDRDAANSSTPKSPKSAPKPSPEVEPVSWEWPGLPLLREAMGRSPLFVVGGDERAMKGGIVKARYGVELEWLPIQRGAARACTSVVSRIRSGKPAGVVILEGLISHSFWDAIRSACDAAGSPYTAAGTGGIGNLGGALDDLESKLSARRRASPEPP